MIVDNNICGYLFALGFFMGGLGILLAGIATLHDTWHNWHSQQPGDKEDVDE